MASLSGSQTMSWLQGGSMVSNESMSIMRPVPPPAALKLTSLRRPISFITLGESLSVTIYSSLPALFVLRSFFFGVSSDFRTFTSIGAIISCIMLCTIILPAICPSFRDCRLLTSLPGPIPLDFGFCQRTAMESASRRLFGRSCPVPGRVRRGETPLRC